MILVIDDDAVMGECVMRVINKLGKSGQLYNNAIDAMNSLADIDSAVPEMVFLDIFLTGPDGFTFLNEMASYADTGKVPVVIVSEKDFSKYDLKDYGVVGCLNKNTMRPEEVEEYVRKYAE